MIRVGHYPMATRLFDSRTLVGFITALFVSKSLRADERAASTHTL
jgi:hypothetical protein